MEKEVALEDAVGATRREANRERARLSWIPELPAEEVELSGCRVAIHLLVPDLLVAPFQEPIGTHANYNHVLL